MPLYPSVDRRPVYFGQDGQPLSFGRIFYYEVGSTSIKKTVYTDRDLTVPASNSQLLNEFGRTDTEIFLGAGDYTIVSKKYVGTGVGAEAEGSIYWENDNQWDDSGAVAGSTPSSGTLEYVGTIEELRALDTATGVVCLLGYYSPSDKAPIVYRWVADSLNSENYGTYIKSSVDVNGTWEAEVGAEVDAKHFGLGITPDAKNAETTAFVFYCYNTSKVARWSSGTYVVNYSTSTSISLSAVNQVIEENTYFSNTGAGKVRVDIGGSPQIKRNGAIQSGSSVGIVIPNIDTIIDQEVRPVWYGLGSRSSNNVFSDIITYCNVANKIRIDTTMTIDNGGWANPLPCLVFYDGGRLYVTGLSGSNKVKFTRIEKISGDAQDGVYTSNGSFLDFSNWQDEFRTSWLANNTLFDAVPSITKYGTITILDSVMSMNSDTTIAELFVESNGRLSTIANLTVSVDLKSETPFFDTQATGNLLKYSNGPLKSIWFCSGSNKEGSLFNSASSSSNSGVIDFAGDSDTWSNFTWTANADYLKIKNLQTVASNFRFVPSGTITSFELENCDITSTTTGVFLPLAQIITIRNSKIALSTLYPNASFGRMLQSATDTSLYIYDSELSASIMFEGEGQVCEIIGSKVYGESNYGVSGKMTILSSELGNTPVTYYTANANKLRGNTGFQMSGCKHYISDLKVYCPSTLTLQNVNIDDVVMDGVASTRAPVIQFITSYANSAVLNCNVSNVHYVQGSTATASALDTVSFGTTGSGTWILCIGLTVEKNKALANTGFPAFNFYTNRVSKGQEKGSANVTLTSGSGSFNVTPTPILVGSLGRLRFVSTISLAKGASVNYVAIGQSRSPVDNSMSTMTTDVKVLVGTPSESVALQYLVDWYVEGI